MIEDTADWPSGTVRIVWRSPDAPQLPLTGAHGLCFFHGKVLVCDINGRGFTIPGGHINNGESVVECLTREASEEAAVDLANVTLIGFIEADHRGNEDFDGSYPRRSAQAICRADVVRAHEFKAHNESSGRRFVTIGELPNIHHEWNNVLQKALEVAVESGAR